MMLQTSDRVYLSNDVETVRNGLIELRNAALQQNDFHYSVLLSHAIAILAIVLGLMNEQ